METVYALTKIKKGRRVHAVQFLLERRERKQPLVVRDALDLVSGRTSVSGDSMRQQRTHLMPFHRSREPGCQSQNSSLLVGSRAASHRRASLPVINGDCDAIDSSQVDTKSRVDHFLTRRHTPSAQC